MNRAVLQACLPAFIALGVAFVLLTVLVRLSGAKLNLKRLRNVGRCDRGSVQSLSLVLTLPLFVMIVLFILQVSQLMVARIIVEYAAFAAARAAIVWIPAQTGEIESHRDYSEPYFEPNQANVLPGPFRSDNPVVLAYHEKPGHAWSYKVDSQYLKYRKIFEAAAIACAPMSPSRELLPAGRVQIPDVVLTTQTLYRSMSIRSAVKPVWIKHKLEYSFENTAVHLGFADKNVASGPTYNRYRTPILDPVTGEIIGYYFKVFRNEIGWQDPLTVTVAHNFALLPGPGRFLAKRLVGSGGQPDLVSGMINQSGNYRERLYSVVIQATAKLTNEGLKPVIRYRQDID